MTNKPEFGTWNQESGIRNPRSRIQRLSRLPLHGAIFWYLSGDTLVLSSKFSRVTLLRFPRQKDNFSCSCSFYKVFFMSSCTVLIWLAFFKVKKTLKRKCIETKLKIGLSDTYSSLNLCKLYFRWKCQGAMCVLAVKIVLALLFIH